MFNTRSRDYFYLVWLCLTYVSIMISEAKPHKKVQQATTSRRILLGGLVPLRSKSGKTALECGEDLRLSGFMNAIAMVHAIDNVNALDSILQNITLVAEIYDTCRSQTIASSHTKEFIKMTLQPEQDVQLAGVVGASVSDVSAKVASILQVFEIPQISFKSTSVTLSDRDLYSYFMRTVPPDSFQAAAMVDVCLKFNWTYVFSVNSEGIYGEKGIEAFHQLAKEKKMHTHHIGKISRLAQEEEFKDIVDEIVTRSEGTAISTIVIFGGHRYAKGVLKAAETNSKTSKFVWLLSDSFDTATLDLSSICILTIQMIEEVLSDSFRNYFDDLNIQDPKWAKHVYLVNFWEDWFKCRLENSSSSYSSSCSEKESLRNVTKAFTLEPIMSAVYAFAHGIDSLQKDLCENETGICSKMMPFERKRLLQHLRNVSFKNFLNTSLTFDQNGEVKALYHIFNFQQVGDRKFYEFVGLWDGKKSEDRLTMCPNKIMWFNAGNNSIPQSYCSAECGFGYIKEEREGYPFEHCWKCHKCDKLQLIVNNTCKTGQPGYIPNAKRDMWIKRELLYLKWSDTVSITVAVVSGSSIILTMSVLLIFLTFHKNRTVKASGRELSCIILTGILLCFIMAFVFIAKPTDLICIARNVGPGLALSMIYSGLFMKINRVYRVFASAKITRRRPPMVRPKSQVLITFGLVSIQILITLLGLLMNTTHASETYYSDEERLVLQCHVESVTYIGSLSYVIVLMILSTIYAFKTRKFPRNFNESKYIGITLYITLAIFILFIAFYVNINDSIKESALIAMGISATGLITLSGLFGQRLIVVFCVKEVKADDTFMTRHPSSAEISKSPVVMGKNRSSTSELAATIPEPNDSKQGGAIPS